MTANKCLWSLKRNLTVFYVTETDKQSFSETVKTSVGKREGLAQGVLKGGEGWERVKG